MRCEVNSHGMKFSLPKLALLLILMAAAPAFGGNPSPAASPTPSPAPAMPPAAQVLHVHVVGLRNSNGKVGCTLYNSAADFPENDAKAFRDIDAPIKNDAAWCNFAGIPPGTYAMVVIHDENGNGKFDRDALGMPLEGYAFSNNAHATFGPPSFADASFKYHGGEQWITITMTY